MSESDESADVNLYIAGFPSDVQKVLRKIRSTIEEVTPGTTQDISYGIPTFKLDGKYVVYFAGFKNHVSVYPVSSGDSEKIKGLDPYLSGKGTAKFKLSEQVPYGIIRQIAERRMKDRLAQS